ncbi:cytochrome P450 [Hymenopellis radicata]|nr:cytochrome P450 [Hymenopellis radicata]
MNATASPTRTFLAELPFNSFSLAACGVGLLVALLFIRRPKARLPPGPRGWPIIGNLFDLPAADDPIPWTSHREKYGPVSSVSVLGNNIVLLNDLKSCTELLDKRSSLYSGRPFFPFASGLVGWDQQMIMAQPGDHFRRMRTLLKSHIGSPAAASPFYPIQELETRRLILRVSKRPDELIPQLRTAAGAIALHISHGYQVETEKTGHTSAWFIDIFPWMKHLPRWFKFHKVAAEFRERNFAQTERPYQFVRGEIAAGCAEPSFTSLALGENPEPATEYALKFAATAIYGGGSDPAVGALSAFVLLLVMHPECQQRARAELDAVVGTKRLPVVTDRPRLPYIEAIIKEVFRWHCVGRIGIPHRVTDDDHYNGFLIPKDALILPHMWNITHDPELYSSPDAFNPDRFLGERPELDPSTYLFGFGRRACPGKDLAHSHMFITIAMILTVYTIGKPKNERGEEIEPVCEFLPGTVSHPRPFGYTLQQTVFRSIKIVADDDHGPGAHLSDLLVKPPHITRLVQHLTIQRSVESTDPLDDPKALPVPPADLFSRLPNLTSLSLFFLSFTYVEDLPSLIAARSRCPISSLKLFKCEFRLTEMNALFHHLLPHLRCLQLEGIFIDELFRHAMQSTNFDPAVVDFDDGHAVQVDNTDDLAYIHVDELCLYARTGTIDVLMDLYSSRKFSPLACVRKLVIRSDIWTPTFVGRINRLVARATCDFFLECLEIRAASLNEIHETLPPIQVGKLKTLHLHLPRSYGNHVDFLVWHTSTLLHLPPTINEIILIVSDLEELVCDRHSEAWLNLDAALCRPKVELVPKLTIITTMKESKLQALLPKAYAKFPMAFR